MITNLVAIKSAFATFISSMHVGSWQSFWYRAYDSISNNLSNNVEPNIKSDNDGETKQMAINAANYKDQHLEILYLSSLCKHICLSREQYNSILLSIWLLQKMVESTESIWKGGLPFWKAWILMLGSPIALLGRELLVEETVLYPAWTKK